MSIPTRYLILGSLLLMAGACGGDGPTGSQEQFGTVTGAVRADGVGVSGVSLVLTRGTQSLSATSGANGAFSFAQVQTGSWTLAMSPPQGFEPVGSASAPVTVAANQAATVDFQIRPIATGVSVIRMLDNSFAPNDTTVAVGTTIRWRNDGTFAHNTTGPGGAWASTNLAQNGTFDHTFSTAGVFEYTCTLHDGMNGIVRVQ
jgi:plastocyanin